jgi:excisionase family DNA binding protein
MVTATDSPDPGLEGELTPGKQDPSKSFDRCFTIKQAARILGTSSETVRRLIKDDRIAHQRVSARRIVIRESALHAYLAAVTRGARP